MERGGATPGAEGLCPRGQPWKLCSQVWASRGSTWAGGLPTGRQCQPLCSIPIQGALPMSPDPGSRPLLPGSLLWSRARTHLAVHVGFRPGDISVTVDDHGAAEHVQVLHHVLLGICQRGDLRVVACGGEGPHGCGRRGSTWNLLLGMHTPRGDGSLLAPPGTASP